MDAFAKVMLCILMLTGTPAVQASSIGMEGRGSGWYREQGPLSGDISGTGLTSPTGKLVIVQGSGLKMSDYELANITRSSSGTTPGPVLETADVPTLGALGLFMTVMIGAGVIARKKHREQKHEALGS